MAQALLPKPRLPYVQMMLVHRVEMTPAFAFIP